MDNRAVVERVMKNLGFVTDPGLKRKVAGSERNHSVATDPLNVKIKVRKKAMQESFSTRFKSEPTVPKLISTESNETIMSFDMFIVASDSEQKREQKLPRKKGFGKWKSGLCIGATNNDEDEPPYMPDSGYSENISNVGSTSKSDDVLRLKFPISKNTNEPFRKSNMSREEKTFLGKKCKPGGCLDPPFREDKYAYMPKEVPGPLVKKTKISEIVGINENNLKSGQEKKKSRDSDMLFKAPTIAPIEDSDSTLYLNKQDSSIHSITTYPFDDSKKKHRTKTSNEKKTSEIDYDQVIKRDQEIKIPKHRSPSRDNSIISSIFDVHKKNSSKKSTLIYPLDDEKKIARTKISSEDNESKDSKFSKYKTPSKDIPRPSYDAPVSTFYKPPKKSRLSSDIHQNMSKEIYLNDKSNAQRPQISLAIQHDYICSEEYTDTVNEIKLSDIKSPEHDKIKPSYAPLPVVLPIKSAKINDDEITTLLPVPDLKEPLHIKDAALSVNTTTLINDPLFMDDSKNISNLSFRLDNKSLHNPTEIFCVDGNSARELEPPKKIFDVVENNSKQKINKSTQNIPMSKDEIENREFKGNSNKFEVAIDTPLIVTAPKDSVLLKIQPDPDSLVTQVDKHGSKTKSSNKLANQGLVPFKSIDRHILDESKLSTKQIPVKLVDYIAHKTVAVTNKPEQQNSIVRTIYQPKIDQYKAQTSSKQLVERTQGASFVEYKDQLNVLRSENNENDINDSESHDQNLKLSTYTDSQSTIPLQEYLEKKLITADSRITNTKDISNEDLIKYKLKDTLLDSENQDKESEKLERTHILREKEQGVEMVNHMHASIEELIDDVQQKQNSWNLTLKDSDPSSYKGIDIDATADKIVDPIHQIQDSCIMPEESDQTYQPDYSIYAADKLKTKELTPVNRITDTPKGSSIKIIYLLNPPVDEFVNEEQNGIHIQKNNREIIKINQSNKIVDPRLSHNNDIIYTLKEFGQTDQTNFAENSATKILPQAEHKSSFKSNNGNARVENQIDMTDLPMLASFYEKSQTLDNYINISVDDDRNNKKDSNMIEIVENISDSGQHSKVNRISLISNDDVNKIIKSDLTKNIPTGKRVDTKHQSHTNSIAQILDDHNKIKASNNDGFFTSSVKRPDIASYKVAAKDSQYKNSLPLSQISKQDFNTINLDLTFQSYMNNKNERFLKTVSAGEQIKRFSNDTITNLESQITLFQDEKVNEINIPVDPEIDMTIQIKKHNANVSRSKTEVKLTSKSVQTRGSEITKANNLNQNGHDTNANDKVGSTLTDVYERELVPLQIMIRNLKNEIDNLVTQQLPLKKKTCNPRKVKQPRLLLFNKRFCGCSP